MQAARKESQRAPEIMKRLLRPNPKIPYRSRPHLPSLILTRSIATHIYSHHAKQLSILPTNVDTSSSTYKQNATQYDELMAQLRTLHQKIEKGGPEKAREKHVARGKMLVREYDTN